MNSVWHFYDPATGIFTGRTFSAPESHTQILNANTPDGHKAFNANGAHIDHMRHRLDLETNQIVEYQPPQPSTEHEWDESAKRWKFNAEASGRAERKTVALARIAHLEANVQPRVHRELLLKIANRLGIDGEQSQDIDEEIAALRRDIIG